MKCIDCERKYLYDFGFTTDDEPCCADEAYCCDVDDHYIGYPEDIQDEECTINDDKRKV